MTCGLWFDLSSEVNNLQGVVYIYIFLMAGALTPVSGAVSILPSVAVRIPRANTKAHFPVWVASSFCFHRQAYQANDGD